MAQRYFKKSAKPNIPVETVEVMVEKPTHFVQQNHLGATKSMKKWYLNPLVIFTALGLALGIFLIIYGLIFLNRFELAAQTSWQSIWTALNNGKKINPFAHQKSLSYVVLGLDEIRNQHEGSRLTDTMMVITIEESGRITLFSLPRDLWIDSLKTKINALYYYGEESEKNSGTTLVKDVITNITGLPIAGYLVINMDTVKTVIDAMGGLAIDIPKSFTDTEFPREDVDIATVTDPALLYETVSFNAGPQRLDGTQALKYIRSRHSDDQSEGNDVARVRRQQQIIQAIIKQATNLKNLTNPTLLGNWYNIWKTSIKTDIADEQAVALGWYLRKQPITLITTQIPIQDNKNAGILIHPPQEKYDLWVYEPIDPTWAGLKGWIAQQLAR